MESQEAFFRVLQWNIPNISFSETDYENIVLLTCGQKTTKLYYMCSSDKGDDIADIFGRL